MNENKPPRCIIGQDGPWAVSSDQGYEGGSTDHENDRGIPKLLLWTWIDSSGDLIWDLIWVVSWSQGKTHKNVVSLIVGYHPAFTCP